MPNISQSRPLSASSTTAAATAPQYARLTNRSLIRLDGPDARLFIYNLVPAKMDAGDPSPIYTVFLSPHGRILNDVFIYPPRPGSEEWLIEVDSASAGDIMKHLRKHKLRSRFKLERLESERKIVVYSWPVETSTRANRDSDGRWQPGGQDPRPGMGMRWLWGPESAGAPHPWQDGAAEEATLQDYTIHRMRNGVAEGQLELPLGASLPQESNVDLLGGIDFFKGCYLGQELTIRTHHTGVVRKRILPCQLYAPDHPPPTDATSPQYDARATLALPPSQSNISKMNARGRARSSGKWLAGVGNIGLALCRLEMMTDIQLTADRTNYDPREEYHVQWEEQGRDGGETVMLRPFVPDWLRVGVMQNLQRKEKKARPQEMEEDFHELE